MNDQPALGDRPLSFANWTAAFSATVASNPVWDDIERAAIAAEEYDPDDPAVVAALARVSAVLAELGRRNPTYPPA